MKKLKYIFKLIGLVIISISFSQCASTIKLEQNIPNAIGECYYQNWVAGVKGGGSGTNVFIQTKDENITLDSVYFRGQVAKLNVKPANKMLFIGYLKSSTNMQNIEVSESNLKAKYADDIPFELKNDECVVSYLDNGKVKYFKIQDLKGKTMNTLPMSAPTKH